ncbi:MAG: hypothetical protein ABIJ59_12880 [Pseudomonadota bacterium]
MSDLKQIESQYMEYVNAIESLKDMVVIIDKDYICQEKTNLIKELQANIKKIKQINGILPICMSCRKVQDHKGYWNQIESYFQDLLQVNLSQCICPECKEKLYTDIKI